MPRRLSRIRLSSSTLETLMELVIFQGYGKLDLRSAPDLAGDGELAVKFLDASSHVAQAVAKRVPWVEGEPGAIVFNADGENRFVEVKANSHFGGAGVLEGVVKGLFDHQIDA